MGKQFIKKEKKKIKPSNNIKKNISKDKNTSRPIKKKISQISLHTSKNQIKNDNIIKTIATNFAIKKDKIRELKSLKLSKRKKKSMILKAKLDMKKTLESREKKKYNPLNLEDLKSGMNDIEFSKSMEINSNKQRNYDKINDLDKIANILNMNEYISNPLEIMKMHISNSLNN